MRKLFGTDGIRGKSNIFPMTAEVALRLGQAAAIVFKRHSKGERTKAVIGKDTRKSGDIFEYALTSGLCSMGVDVLLAGRMPTPAVAHITKSFAADFGIMITASHNPASDNGIKFFDKGGFKLSSDVEKEIEQIIASDIDTSATDGIHVGKATRIQDAAGRYIEFTKNAILNRSIDGLKVVLDCANGAAFRVAPLIFRELGAEVIVMNQSPDGININDQCGSTHPEVVRSAVLGREADIGMALDGDADRVILIDEKGEEVNGDVIVAMCALDMKERGKLRNDGVVGTVMTNIGFDAAMKKAGIAVVRAKVGDHHVVEELRKNNYSLGGEQSGHIIFFNHTTTGDGTLTALKVLSLMKRTGKKLSELAQVMTSYPQVLKNLEVKKKKPLESMPSVQEAISDAEEQMGADGRVLVRYSGTENLCRVMVEGKDEQQIQDIADTIIESLKTDIGE